MRIFILSTCTALLMSGCGAFAQDIDAEALYQQHCAQCHGEDLAGGNAQSMIDGVWQFGDSEGYIRRNIKHGITHLGMPAYEDTLNDDEIAAITDFIVAAEDRAAPEPPEIPETLQTQDYNMTVEVIAEGLDIPWAIDWIDEDTAIITERPGPVRLLKDGELMEPLEGTPEVLHEGQGGMMDVAVDPDYDANGWVYLGYSHALPHPRGGDRPPVSMTRIVRGKIEGNAWTSQEVLWEAQPEHYLTTRIHYGCRIVFDPEGLLYFALGERSRQDHAQEITRPNGKIHRIHRDGSIPEDNPFTGVEDAYESIFTYGNRNPQGLAVHPDTGVVWETEHGPMGGDEVNVITAGLNYGWPVITYGRNYNGSPVTDMVEAEGMAQPALYWKPSIAACGLDFIKGDEYPDYHGHLLAGALRFEEVKLLTVTSERVIHEETIWKSYGRVRDVAVSPSGKIHIVLNQPGKIVRLSNAGKRDYE